MATIDLIWRDFADSKYGDEYLILYSNRQRNRRKIFKFVNLGISAGGVVAALLDAKVPTVIICIVICLIQLVGIFESSFVATEKELEEFCKLRLLYCEHSGKLERLFSSLYNERVSDVEAENEYFNLKKHKIDVMEPIDTGLCIKKIKRLLDKAEISTNHYLNRYI